MKIELTNTIIRAFRKRDNRISFHLRTHFLVHSRTSFSISTYLRDIASWFILPNGQRIDFETISYPVHPEIPFNGKFLVSELHLATVSELTKVSTCAADLYIRFHFSFTGHPSEEAEQHSYISVVRLYCPSGHDQGTIKPPCTNA